MAYLSPGIQPGRAFPNFGTGYATGQASEGAKYWRNLTVAFAPFLGPTNNPTKLLFGTAIRSGTSSFSGGRSTATPGGWGWEFTSTSDGIICCTAADLVPIISPGGYVQITVLIGVRSTDGVLRNTWLYGTGTSQFNAVGLRHISDGRYLPVDTSVNGAVWTPPAGYTLQDQHVLSCRWHSDGGSYILSTVLADGQVVTPNAGTAVYVGNGDFHIGQGGAGAGGDLNIVQFLYFWNKILSDSEIAEISADPGILFRPVPVAISSGTGPIISDITLIADPDGSASMTPDLLMDGILPTTGDGQISLTPVELIVDGILPAAGDADPQFALGSINDFVGLQTTGDADPQFALGSISDFVALPTSGDADPQLTLDYVTTLSITLPTSGSGEASVTFFTPTNDHNEVVVYGLGSLNLLLLYGFGSSNAPLFEFTLARAVSTGPLSVRLTFTTPPRAVDPTATDDALNLDNLVLSGPVPSTIVATAPVTGDPLSIDLYLGAPLEAGTWTIAVSPFVEDMTGATLNDPSETTFDVIVRPAATGVDGGAVNEGLIRRHFNPALFGPTWDDLIFALEGDTEHLHGDAYVSDISRLAYLQLFASTASGSFLDRRGSEVGVSRPEDVGLSDAAYRLLINALSNHLLTDHAVHDVLETFYGPDSVRATVTSTLSEPFALRDGDDLQLLFGERRAVTISFQGSQFARIALASAIEVASTIDRGIRAAGIRGFAAAFQDPETGLGQVRIYSDARGVPSGIRVVGGRAQVGLRFPSDVFPDASLTPPFGDWTIGTSPTPGRVRFTLGTPTAYDLSLARSGDRVLIYGLEIPAPLRGAFDVLEVQVTSSTQWFEVAGPTTPAVTVTQLSKGSLIFLRSTLRSVHDNDAPSYAVEVGDGLSVVLPATSPVVLRGNGSAGYLAQAASQNILSVDRDADGTVTLTFAAAHGLAVGDFVFVDGVVQPVTAPAVFAGSPSSPL